MQMSAYFVSAGNLHPEFLLHFLKQWEGSVMTMSLVMNLWVSLTKCQTSTFRWIAVISCHDSLLKFSAPDGGYRWYRTSHPEFQANLIQISASLVSDAFSEVTEDSVLMLLAIKKLSNKFVALFLMGGWHLPQRNTGCSPYDMLT
jgi:hypothetical protein